MIGIQVIKAGIFNMEFLNKQLAQEIVDRTMGIIGKAVRRPAGAPYGIRTRVLALRGSRRGPKRVNKINSLA